MAFQAAGSIADCERLNQVSGDEMRQVGINLLARALQVPEGDESRFAMYQAVSEMREQFLLSRYQVRAYIAAPNPATEKAAREQLSTTVASLH